MIEKVDPEVIDDLYHQFQELSDPSSPLEGQWFHQGNLRSRIISDWSTHTYTQLCLRRQIKILRQMEESEKAAKGRRRSLRSSHGTNGE